MAMKESIGSLRAYFIIIALLAGIKNTASLVQSQRDIAIVIGAFIGVGFAIAYLYIGLTLRTLIVKSPKIITKVILVSMGFLVVGFLFSLLEGVQTAMVAQLIIGLLITWYLLKNVKRLSSEEKGKHIA